MAFSHTYDVNTPDGSVDSPSEADDRMREIKAAIQERLNVEHVFDKTGTEVSHADTGKHTDITTTSIINAGALANTGNLTVNTDKFTVDAATGNVVVAGTLGVTGIATLGDGSKMATNAAPTADAELANKKYVDDQLAAAVPDDDAFGSWTDKDSGGSVALAKDEVYKVGSDGFVSIYDAAGASYSIAILTDGSNPPVTIRRGAYGGGDRNGLTCPVRKDDYWKVSSTTTPDSIYWLPIGTGTCVKQ